MALTIRLTPLAVSDLAAIRGYLMRQSPKGAENVRRAIAATIDRLAEFPGIGRATDLATIQVVMADKYPFRIYYKVINDDLIIVHVRHAARRRPKSLPG